MKNLRLKLIVFFGFIFLHAVACAAVYSWDAYKTNVLGVNWQPGDAVTIDGDVVYYYNITNSNDTIDAVIGALTIQGGGEFYCNHPERYSEVADVRHLQVESIVVTGADSKFECGSNPALMPVGQNFTGTFIVNFKESASCQVSMAAALNPMCQGFHVMDNGKLYLFGNKGHNTWTRVIQTNIPGADGIADNQITVASAEGWNINDEITIAPSEIGLDVFDSAPVQNFKILSINGNVLTLDGSITHKVNGDAPYIYNVNNPLVYQYGDQNVAGTLAYRYKQKLNDSVGNVLYDQDGNSLLSRILSKDAQPINTLDERTEVANKTRNIRFIGDQTPGIKNQQLGVHMMFMASPGDIHVDGIEIINGGRVGQLGRYPFHWHWAFDSEGDFIRNSSIHDAFNRCITVHRTQNVVVEKNVCVNTIGHAYFLEDGAETGNRFIDNIAVFIKPPATGLELLNSDVVFGESTGHSITGPAAYWISNPDNIFIGNAASSAGSGYWFSFKDASHNVAGTVVPMGTPASVFSGNRVHAAATGIILDGPPNGQCMKNPRNDCTGLSDDEKNRSGDHEISPLNPATNRYMGAGNIGMIVMDDFTSYKSSNFALWMSGNNLITAAHMTLADSRVDSGLVLNEYISRSLIVGASQGLSVSEHTTLKGDGVYLSGILLYDGPSRFNKLHFANFDDVTKVAIPFALFGAAANRPQQFASEITFANLTSPMLDFAHDISFKPKRRENWSTGLYVTDNSFGDYQFMVDGKDVFTDYSVRPDEPADTDAISTFFSPNVLANDCVDSAAWLAKTGRVINNASICPGHFGALHFNGTMDAIFTRITYDPDYPDVVFDHEKSIFGWGPVGNFSFPDALIKTNHGGKDPNDVDDLTYNIVFKNEADFSAVNNGQTVTLGNKMFDVAPKLMYRNEWSPWLVFVPQRYKSCVLTISANANLLVQQPNTLDRNLRVRSRATVPDTERDPDGSYGLYVYALQDYAIPVVCGPDTDEDGILNSDTNDDDGDGVDDALDGDDDNDGVLDAVDFYPANPGNTLEIILPLDGIYKGGVFRSYLSGQ